MIGNVRNSVKLLWGYRPSNNHQCIVGHTWPMHGWSTIPESYYLTCLYGREIIPFLLLFYFWFHFVTFFIIIRCNFRLILSKITFIQSSSRRDQSNIWQFKLLAMNSLKFNQNKLKTLSQSLRRYCVKDVRKNIFIKTLCGRTEIH